ncbi:MAG: methylase [Pseudomonadota bacterium]|nr:methylase [Pseudomonadota bacterium]
MHPTSPTRGRTAPGRLTALDAWVCHAERALLLRSDGPWLSAPFVDVGLGDLPWTTLESAAALRMVRADLEVLGIDLDAARVAAAARYADARTHFCQGGFDLPSPVRLARVLNVLRQYPPAELPEIHRRLGVAILPGGLVLEGTSDARGGVLVAHLLRRGPEGLAREGLLFHTDFSSGFAPLLFRDRLPRDLRRVAPGTPLHTFFAAWTAAWSEARVTHDTPHALFTASIAGLAARVEGLDPDPWLTRGGYLVWRPPGGVPATHTP